MNRAFTRIVLLAGCSVAALAPCAFAAAEPFIPASPMMPPPLRFVGPAGDEAGVPDAVDASLRLPMRISASDFLAYVDNDNDGKRSYFNVRTDDKETLTRVEYGHVEAGSNQRSIPLSDALRACPVGGSDRIDGNKHCGVELENARGSTSAVRLWTPDLDPATGGEIVIIYLKHYAVFGRHEVADFHMRLARAGQGWGLFVSVNGAQRRVGGLFMHRASRGIGSVTACLDASCPADWSTRDRGENDNLPPVWENSAH